MNDSYGHEAGDILLKETANALKNIWNDAVYRIGGDEFVVVLENCHSNERTCKEQIAHFHKALAVAEKNYEKLVFSCAVGFQASIRGKTFEEILRLADSHMYADKEEYKKAKKTEKKEEEPEQQVDIEALKAELEKNLTKQITRQVEMQIQQQLSEGNEPDMDAVQVQVDASNMSVAEYDAQLSESTRLIKQEALSMRVNASVNLDQIINNIRMHNTKEDPLYLIAIASIDMSSLILIRDMNSFIDLLNEEDMDYVSCSYIYAIHKKGSQWYGSNNATPAIKSLFDTLAGFVAVGGGRIKPDKILQIPHIDIFKEIYM